MLLIALSVALFAPTVLIFALRALGKTTLSWSVRFCFWAFGLLCFLPIAAHIGVGEGLLVIGLGPITTGTIWVAAVTTICLMVGAGLLSIIQRILKVPFGDHENFAEIASLSLPLRLFLVLTAGIMEEILYRGVGIAVGAEVLGSGVLAVALSIFAFVLAHFRWRSNHLLQVGMAGTVLSLAFWISGDLWVCIFAHLVVDGIGFLLMPAIVARRRANVPVPENR